MHVTLLFSREPVDWLKMGESRAEEIEIKEGGPRVIEVFGPPDDRVIVISFASTELQWRHQDMCYSGASHDYEDYTPHITFSRDKDPERLERADQGLFEPYRGRILLGPEVFERIEG